MTDLDKVHDKCSRIVVADHQPMIRLGLRTLIERQADLQLIGEAPDGDKAINLIKEFTPDIAILSLHMPGISGPHLVRLACRACPATSTLVFSNFGSEEEIYNSIRAGARGYILKDSSSSEIVEGIHQVLSGRRWMPPDVAARFAMRMQRAELTSREAATLHLLVKGFNNHKIAEVLNISESTVKNHVNGLLTKLGAEDRLQAVAIASARGLTLQSRFC